MKKIIAISVMFTLVAVAVFADTSVGGNLKISTQLLTSGNQTDDGKNPDDVMAGSATIHDAHVNVTWSGENAGGMMRLWNVRGEWPDYFTYWWWKPVEQFRIQLGQNADGDWEHGQITRWGYNAEAQGGIAIDVDGNWLDLDKGAISALARQAAWWGGFGTLGLALSILPVEGFEVNIGIPFDKDATAEEIYLNSDINFKVDIPDIGTVRLVADLLKSGDADPGANIHFAFYLSAVENMGVEIGAAFKDEFKTIEAGLGYKLEAEDLNFKARLGFAMPDGGDMCLGIGILPSYNLGSLVFFFNAGFGIDLDATDNMDWFVNPYIKVPANTGDFYAGLRFQGVGDADIKWSIPIGWNVYF